MTTDGRATSIFFFQYHRNGISFGPTKNGARENSDCTGCSSIKVRLGKEFDASRPTASIVKGKSFFVVDWEQVFGIFDNIR